MRRAPAILLATLLARSGAAFAAGGHHGVDDASILGPGRCEFETWVTRASPADELLHAGGQCGIAGVEVGIAAEPARQDSLRSDNWQVQLKWAGELLPNAAAGFSVTPQWDTRAAPRFQGTTLSGLLTLRPLERWQLHANLGRDFLHDGNLTRSGVAADWTTPDGRWLFAVERYLENRTGFARAGARWFVSNRWTLEASRAQRLHGPRPSNWTLAVTRSFGNTD